MKSTRTPEERKARQRQQQAAWYQRNKPALQLRMQANYRANREKRIAQQLDRYFGVTDVQAVRARLWMKQGGKCALCGCRIALEKGNAEKLPAAHLDHDHETGEIRELLCSACNTGLGLFNDEPARLQRAISYLKRWEKRFQQERADQK